MFDFFKKLYKMIKMAKHHGGYYKYSSSHKFLHHKHQYKGHQHYGYSHYKKKHSSHSFFSS